MIRPRLVWLALVLFLLGLAGGLSELWHPGKYLLAALDFACGACAAALVWAGARVSGTASRVEGSGTMLAVILALAFLIPLALAYGVLDAYPVSTDEFGYNYLADTLRHGRLWNAPAPPELHDVVQTFYMPDRDGKRFSQYPPGWPAILAIFASVDLRAAANPVLGLVAAVFMALALRELGVVRAQAAALLALFALAPFTLFNNASYFNHTLTAVCVLAIAWRSLRERRHRAAWSQPCIGLAFSVLLATRYEVFAISCGLYVLEGLLRERGGFVRRSIWAALGALPLTLLFAWYNWRIVGSPFRTTLSWSYPEVTFGLYGHGVEGPNNPFRAAERTAWFVAWWAEFASLVVLPFAAVAVWRGVRRRSLHWFDLMLPALAVFFVFYPDGGGYQYGPRYWFVGWILMPLTLGAGFGNERPWALGRWRFDAVRLAGLQLAAYCGFLVSYSAYAHLLVSAVQEPLRVAATAPPPALVLMGNDELKFGRWQRQGIPIDSLSTTTRNGVDGFDVPVMFGTDLGEERTAALCRQLRGRTVWRLHIGGVPSSSKLEPGC